MNARLAGLLLVLAFTSLGAAAEPPSTPKEGPDGPHVIYTVAQLQKISPSGQKFWQVSPAEAEAAWKALCDKIEKSKLPKDSPMRTKLASYAIGFGGRVDSGTGKKVIEISGSTQYSKERMPGLVRPPLGMNGDPYLFAVYDLESRMITKLSPNGEIQAGP